MRWHELPTPARPLNHRIDDAWREFTGGLSHADSVVPHQHTLGPKGPHVDENGVLKITSGAAAALEESDGVVANRRLLGNIKCAAGRHLVGDVCELCEPGSFSRLPACVMKKAGPFVASRGLNWGNYWSGNQVTTFAGSSLENYELAFTMKLAEDWSPETGEWQSILHIGDTDQERLPKIMFPKHDNSLYVVQSYSDCLPGQSSTSCEWGVLKTSVDFAANQTYEIKVQVANYQMEVYVDGAVVGAESAPGSASYAAKKNPAVYVGDPWFDAAKVEISDVCLRPGDGPVCQQCLPGTFSNTLHTECECGPGTYGFWWAGGQVGCMNCGDGGTDWKLDNWDQDQYGLTSDDCKCARGRDGRNCDREVCAATTPVVSLGFLTLEVQWSQPARMLSKNEAFSGISGAFVSADTDGNNRLSVAEARRAIRAGGMAVPLEVTHVWSRVENSVRVEISEVASSCTENGVCFVEGQYCPTDGYCCVGSTWVAASTCRGDVTITDMIEDELARLLDQGTKEYYERPPGSGEIAPMRATYPNNHDGDTWSNEICEAQSTHPPKLTWTVDRNEKVIYEQCVYLNGVALSGADDGLDNDIISGGDCNADPSKCSYEFQLPNSFQAPVDLAASIGSTSSCSVAGGELLVKGFGACSLDVPITWNEGSLVVEFETRGCYETDCTTPVTGPQPGFTPHWFFEPFRSSLGSTVREWPDLWWISDSRYGFGDAHWDNSGTHGIQTPQTHHGPKDVDPTQWHTWRLVFNVRNQCVYLDEWTVDGVAVLTSSRSYCSAFGTTTYLGFMAYSETYAYVRDFSTTRSSFSTTRSYEVLPISKQIYCVETKFCPLGAPCKEATADPALTIKRCISGLQYDGTPMDIIPTMLGAQGVALRWLDTSTVATGYRVYKVADVTVPFAKDTSARLLREVVMRGPACGLTHDYLDFRDITTGSEPGIKVGYAVVPLDDQFKEIMEQVGEDDFFVPWFGDIYVEVAAEGGGPVEDATVRLSHLVDGQPGTLYTDFVEAKTDEYGEAHLEVRVQDPAWSGLTQHFRVTVEKISKKASGDPLVHVFSPSSEDVTVRHLGQGTYEFIDTTSVVISGTVSHAGFGAAYFAEGCPHTKSEDPTDCMCPVDGAEVYIIRASGAEQEVTINQGKFATAVFEGETVTIGLRVYKGTNGDVPHDFSVTHGAGAATVVEGTAPTFEYTASEDAELHFLDTSTQTLAATYVVGADRMAAEYVNGLPVVAKVERCGWERPAWALRGVATFELGAAAVEVRALGDDEVEEAKYYGSPGKAPGPNDLVCDESYAARDKYVDGDGDDSTMIRGCRAKIVEVKMCDLSATANVPRCQTIERPCATKDYTYVDELPKTRNFDVDLSILTDPTTASVQPPVEFLIASPLCLDSVSAAATPGTTLQWLVDPNSERREYDLFLEEDLLLAPPADFTPPEGTDLYGEACTDNLDAVFREGDAVGFGFELVEREPLCLQGGLYPWDDVVFGGTACAGYKNTPPSPDLPIAIRVADGVSRTETSAIYGQEPFEHIMTAGNPNPFAPFSLELSVEFTRAFDNAKILFVRHALVVGVIPEEVPQVWTVATNPTLIYLILYDPPGGDSFATLAEGSTISTSMAIDGSHAAELDDSWNLGTSVGYADNIRASVGFGAEVEKNVLSGGISGGASYAQTPVDVSVSRSTSRHFDVGISFSTGISTSSSPYLPGQPSDIIVGGGANLRFISAIEIFATETPESVPTELCLGGLTTKQFLPEQISTWVMSVYEIEKTMERLGAALTDPNTKLEAKPGVPDPRKDLVKQIENWQTVLSNYRAATIRDQAESIAEQLSQELDQFQVHFKKFLAEAKDGKNGAFKDFLVDGLDELEGSRAAKLAEIGAVAGLPGGPVGAAIGASVGAAIGGASQAAGSAQLKSYDSKNQGRVNRAAKECVSAAALADPSGAHNLCKVYDDIKKKIELKDSLFGICDFAKDCCEDESEKCACRDAAKVDESGACACCEGDDVPKCEPVDHFCKRDHYRKGKDIIGAFDALHDTTQFITFSGTTGLDFNWDIAESRGQELTSTHDANVADALGGSVGGGLNIGRRRLESLGDGGVPGYAYPISGRVLAKSKKLLAVTPEALEERRRQLLTDSQKIDEIHKAATEPESVDNPCRRRLDGLDLSDEERRRLGATVCAGFEGGTSTSFAVSLGRAASKDAEHSRSVSIFLGDGNAQDVFAVKISQNAVYGTPIFTTMGGRSSCVGETGTTRRDSRVTIKEIKPLCVSQEDIERSDLGGEALCKSMQTCECTGLAPGEDAIFSVVLENLSPWVDSVTYLLRAGFGASTAWDSGKYTRDIACDPGDPGDLVIKGLAGSDLRDGTGIILDPLDYGQFEVKIRVSRSNFAPQCFSFQDIELELVSECENTDVDGRQDVYQYQALMNPDNGAVSVVHPKFVGRPVGLTCDKVKPSIDLQDGCDDEDSARTDCLAAGIGTVGEPADTNPASTYRGDGKWCYSDLNLAMGCTASPITCWETCSEKIAELNNIKDVSMTAAASAGCPISFIQQTDDKGEKFKCSTVDGPFELKAVDWEEETGQCRCQNSCDCLVDDLYSYDVTKNEGDPGYKNRTMTTHLLTEDGLNYPPTNKDGKNASCGLYTFTEDTKARGPDTSTETINFVSWKNEVRGCTYTAALNHNPLATVDDDTCEFAGCKYEAALNYDPKATKDDGSCNFPSGTITGKLCLSGVDPGETKATIETLKAQIAKIAGVAITNVKISQGTGGCTRRLQDSLLSGRILQTTVGFDYKITAEATRVDSVLDVLSTDLLTAFGENVTVVSADLPQLDDSCEECTSDDQCEPGSFCEFGSGGGTRKLRFGNIQSGCCRAL